MKTKGNNSDVAHFWANQTQESLSNANGSFYFKDNIIYSYGLHFPIARHMDDIILFTNDSYRNTTAKQMNLTRRAISHKKVFTVSDVLACNEKQHTDNFNDYQKRFVELIKSAVMARSNKTSLLESAKNLANEANEYAQFFKLDIIPINTKKLDMDSIKESLKQVKIERAKQAKIRAKKLLAENTDNTKTWRNGGNFHSSMHSLPCMLRINTKNETIETSHGANIPISFAPKLWRYIKQCIKNNTVFNDSFRVGHYSLNHINKNGDIKVGCHNIKYKELLTVAKQLKLA